jgi:hypothetical protein
MQCTSCLCDWPPEGFYTQNGEPVQPCRICRCDTASIYYLRHAEQVRERKRKAYYDRLEAKRDYYRQYRRRARAQATV